MHYYQFNIADYRKDTQHLTPMENYIYRELMDWYYLDEQPIPRETQRVSRRLRLVSENEPQLIYVLKEFFKETENGWVHGRIERELESYRHKAEVAKANGSKGGRPKKTQRVNSAKPKETQPKANHKPITNNQEPIRKDIYTAKAAIDRLNEVTGKKFKHTDSNLSAVKARLADGYTLDDMEYVIQNKTREWLGTENEKYLRPETLFRPSKFDGYLNEPVFVNQKRSEFSNSPSTRNRTLEQDLTDRGWAE